MSALLASVSAVAGDSAAAVVIGLVAAAFAAERGLPGAVRDGDPSAFSDLGVLATRGDDRAVADRLRPEIR